MQAFFKLMTLAIITSLLLISCGKKDEVINTAVPKIPGKYKMTGLTIKSNDQTINVFDKITACIKDDYELFNEDGTYGSSDEGISCTAPQNITGNWKAYADVLLLEIDDIWVTIKIESHTTKKLVLSAEGSVKLQTGTIRGYWTKTLEKVN